MENFEQALQDLKEGIIDSISISKEDFLEFREILIKREDFKHFRGIAKQGGTVEYSYEDVARS
ncbi:MAG: hypothetical protein ABWX61_04610 [Paenisporosarcina sp.]